MEKFNGNIGFKDIEEVTRGVYVNNVIVRHYTGDTIRLTRQLESTDHVNPDIKMNIEFSILGDTYAHNNFLNMLYIEYKGVKWVINTVDPQYPRLIVTIGGEYNVESGPTTN